MKNEFLTNTLWVILLLLFIVVIVNKIDQLNVRCVDSIVSLDQKLTSGGEFIYENN